MDFVIYLTSKVKSETNTAPLVLSPTLLIHLSLPSHPPCWPQSHWVCPLMLSMHPWEGLVGWDPHPRRSFITQHPAQGSSLSDEGRKSRSSKEKSIPFQRGSIPSSSSTGKPALSILHIFLLSIKSTECNEGIRKSSGMAKGSKRYCSPSSQKN